MPSLSTRNSSFVFVISLVGAIGLMVFLMLSIWQDGQELATERGDTSHVGTQEADPVLGISQPQGKPPNLRAEASVVQPRQGAIAQPNRNRRPVLEPAPDFEPVETKIRGE